MERRITDSDFKRHQKVVAAVDLEDVPKGTPGKILMVNGFAWTRYRVRFDNGVDRGSLDGGVLMARADWEELQRKEAAERRRAEQARIAEELRSQVLTGPASH